MEPPACHDVWTEEHLEVPLLLSLWLLAAPVTAEPQQTIQAAFAPPPGARRVTADAWAAWLQQRRVHDVQRPVRTWNGKEVGHRARVVDMPLVRGDLQQCADSAIRLRAEWLRAQGLPVTFHATSGDPMPWSRFAGGQTPYAEGRGLAWREGSTGEWNDYLRLVFTWAGTASLAQFDTVPIEAPSPGTMLLQGGFPGHVVVILDVARTEDQTWLLIGEGFMPAQDFHVELGPEHGWWPWDGQLDLGHWRFTAEHLRAFR